MLYLYYERTCTHVEDMRRLFQTFFYVPLITKRLASLMCEIMILKEYSQPKSQPSLTRTSL